jgi:hypothetical protein
VGTYLAEFVKKYRIEERHGGLIFYKAVLSNYAPWCCGASMSIPDQLARKYSASGYVSPRPDDHLMTRIQTALMGVYRPGAEVKCTHYNTDRAKACGEGLHVGTLKCAMRFQSGSERIVECLVMPEDVVCVPDIAVLSHANGLCQKVRCKRLLVLEDVTDKVCPWIPSTS